MAVSIDELLKKAVSFHSAGQFAQAEQIYLQILAQVPDQPDAIHFMGVLAYNVGKNDIAIAYLRKAIDLLPNHAGVYSNMGNVFQSQGQYDKSMIWYKKAIDLDPGHTKAHNNLGVACLRAGEPEQALKYIETAITQDSQYVDGYINYGEVLKEMGDYDRALAAYDKALSLSPEAVEARWNRAIILLTKGEFTEGWQEYEWRWRRPTTRTRSFSHSTAWQGQDLSGKVLFVYEEQGLGDTMQFIRYLPMIHELGARVVLEVSPAMIRLVDTNRYYDRLLVGQKNVDTQPVDRFDFHVPLLSLPRILKTQIETIPDRIPYLTADPALCQIWKNRMAGENSFKVGLVWAGHPDHKNDARRSIHLRLFNALGNVEGVSFYSLQKDKHARWTDVDDLALFEKDLGPEISDFADTAAIIANLDLLISVDTSVVHLAGAMGKPVWTLLPFAPDFRWLLDRKDSPWYPSMKLFRQPAPGQWGPVIELVLHELAEQVSCSSTN